MRLKKYHEKKTKNMYILLFASLSILLVAGVLFYKSYALYEEAKDFDVINGTVEDPGDIYFAYYIDGEISREMPAQNTGYTLDETKSNCNNNVTVTWDNASWEAKVNHKNYSATTNTRTKCTLYFNKTAKTVSTILGNIEVNSYTPDFTKSACADSSCKSHEEGIFETNDYDGNATYYYRGSVENNYLKFAGYYWRIIRINSNGSVRIIYDGTSAHNNGEFFSDRSIGEAQFNSNFDNNMYVGYMYESGNAHGKTKSSIIKTIIDEWYENNLINYDSRIDNTVGFCGDRSTLNLQHDAGTGIVDTYYKAYLRIQKSMPTLTCENTLDYYSTSYALTGNKSLKYSIGLITADEVMFAGHAGGIFDGIYNKMYASIDNYLTNENYYWLMTPAGGYNPYGYSEWFSHVFFVNASGGIDDAATSNNGDIRPVINIRSDVTITGSGTKNDPYIVN
mgnify:CR=1 FL=1